MKLFNTLCLEINARCNRKCSFCPVAYNTRPDERMDFDLVVKAAEELAALKYKGRVEFYIYNEPLKDWAYLIQCLTEFRNKTKACLMVATNGDYIKGADDIDELFSLGLNQLLINCYSPGLYEKRMKWLAGVQTPLDSDNVYGVLSSKSKTLKLEDKSNPEEFGTGVFRLVNRAGNIPEFLPALTEPVSRMCTKSFRLLNINWRGEALVCCMDYHSDVSYGTLNDNSLVDLWHHPVMFAYRRKLLKKDRSLPLCDQCDCHAGSHSWNVFKPEPEDKTATDKEVRSLYERRKNARTKVSSST